MQGCVRLRNALKCIEMHLGDYHYSQGESLTSIAAEKINVASAADYKIKAGSPDGRPRAQAQRMES